MAKYLNENIIRSSGLFNDDTDSMVQQRSRTSGRNYNEHDFRSDTSITSSREMEIEPLALKLPVNVLSTADDDFNLSLRTNDSSSDLSIINSELYTDTHDSNKSYHFSTKVHKIPDTVNDVNINLSINYSSHFVNYCIVKLVSKDKSMDYYESKHIEFPIVLRNLIIKPLSTLMLKINMKEHSNCRFFCIPWRLLALIGTNNLRIKSHYYQKLKSFILNADSNNIRFKFEALKYCWDDSDVERELCIFGMHQKDQSGGNFIFVEISSNAHVYNDSNSPGMYKTYGNNRGYNAHHYMNPYTERFIHKNKVQQPKYYKTMCSTSRPYMDNVDRHSIMNFPFHKNPQSEFQLDEKFYTPRVEFHNSEQLEGYYSDELETNKAYRTPNEEGKDRANKIIQSIKQQTSRPASTRNKVPQPDFSSINDRHPCYDNYYKINSIYEKKQFNATPLIIHVAKNPLISKSCDKNINHLMTCSCMCSNTSRLNCPLNRKQLV